MKSRKKKKNIIKRSTNLETTKVGIPVLVAFTSVKNNLPSTVFLKQYNKDNFGHIFQPFTHED